MNRPGRAKRPARRRTLAVAAVVGAVALALTGCSAVTKAVNAIKTVHNIVHGDAAISSLNAKITTADTTAYEVTYETTGAAPVTTVYAAEPPHEFAFTTTVSGAHLDVFASSAGEYGCNRQSPSASSGWTCLKLQGSEVDTYKLMYALYSGSYWIEFLKAYSAIAALNNVKVTSSTMSVNGFSLQCAVVVSGKAPNQSTSKVCVTSQGILGFVSVASKGADFEIKSYSSSPAASLFQLPAGATVTTIPTTTTS
jgi:hypothetical protein